MIDKVTETYHGKELLTYGWKGVIYVAVGMKICGVAVAQEKVIYVAWEVVIFVEEVMETYGAQAMGIYDV